MRCAAEEEHCFPNSLLLALNIAGCCWWVERPAAHCNLSFNPLYQSCMSLCERSGGSLQLVRREPPKNRSSLLEVYRTELVWAVAAVGSLISLCTVSKDAGLVGASRVARLDCTNRCLGQQQPVAILAQPRPFLLVGFLLVAKSARVWPQSA